MADLERIAAYAVALIAYLADVLVRRRRWHDFVDELARIGDELARLRLELDEELGPPPYDQDRDNGPRSEDPGPSDPI